MLGGGLDILSKAALPNDGEGEATDDKKNKERVEDKNLKKRNMESDDDDLPHE